MPFYQYSSMATTYGATVYSQSWKTDLCVVAVSTRGSVQCHQLHGVTTVTWCHHSQGTELSHHHQETVLCCFFSYITTHPITNQPLATTNLFSINLQCCHFEICQWTHRISRLLRLFKLSQILLSH